MGPMTVSGLLPLAWQEVAQEAADTLAADSSGVIDALSREVGDTGRLLASGDMGGVWGQISGGFMGLWARFVPNMLGALFVFVVFYLAYRLVARVLEASLRRSRRADEGLSSLSMKSFRLVSWTFILVMVLSQFGIDVTALLAGLSIAGIALGFAARDTLENFISGVTIMLDRPFHVGDFIEVDDMFGRVQEITLRSTRLQTFNNQVMVMPNLRMINQPVVNHSLLPGLRVEIPFGIAYKEFPAQAREVVLALFEGDSRLDPVRPASVVVARMGDSSVDLIARFYLKDPSDEVPIRFEYVEKIREALREAGIEIPFPHLQLFIDEAKGLRDLNAPGKVDS